MLLLGRVMQRRLVAAGIAGAIALLPITVTAASSGDVDALWNQPNGVSVDSAFYVVQTWWDGMTRAAQSDRTQRGLDELAQANTDLLNAYSLLQEQRTDPGPQPVAIIDPLLSSTYNFVTGSNVKAPVGSLFNSLNQSLLKLEGRGSSDDIVRGLLTDYRAKQASVVQDLPSGQPNTDALLSANGLRESAFLLKIEAEAIPSDGLAGSLDNADQSTVALAAKANGAGPSQGKDQANGKAKDNAGKSQGNPQGKAQPQKKK